MNKILVISDNDLLNQLYKINLQIYINAHVDIVTTSQEAQNAFSDFKKYDLIISVNMIDEDEIAMMSYEYLKIHNLKTSLICIGSMIKEMPEVSIIQSSYNLQNLLRTVARNLGVTAQKMTELEVPKFYPISLSYFNHLPISPCDIYMQVRVPNDKSEFVLCSSKDSSISNLLSKLQNQGIENLYVNSQDRLSIVNQISTSLTSFIKSTETMTVEAKAQALSAGFNFAASQIFKSDDIIQEIVEIAEVCSKIMTSIVGEVTDLRTLIKLLMANKDGYLYIHSVLIAHVSKHIIKHSSWGGDSHVDRINFMVFFHDIYLVPIFLKYPKATSEEDLLFGDQLSDEEKEVILNHARLAGEQISKYKKCPSGIDLLIKQHHGLSNGVGFATDFSDNVSPLSKVFIVAEAFVELFLKEKYQDKTAVIDINILLEKLHDKFPKHTYKKIINTLVTFKT